MPAAVEATGTVVAQATLPGARHLVTLSAPAVARLAGPGQFAMVRCADGWDPYLRRALPFLRAGGEAASFIYTADDPGLAWLARRRLGDRVSLAGPRGRGFELQPATRRLLLVAAREPVAPLLALAERALGAQASVSLVIDEAPGRELAAIIPEAVELAMAAPGDPGALWDLAAGLLPWADQVAAAGPAEALRRLADLGPVYRPGRVQCYVHSPIACGVGWCGACLTELRRGTRRACTGGPVFDLSELA